MSEDKLMNIIVFLFCFLLNMILMITVLASLPLLGQIGILIVVDIIIWILADYLDIL